MGTGGSRIDESQRKNVSENFFKVIFIDRTLYYWIILVICVIAVVGNLLVIRSVIIRKYKYLQKTCMISLAISDLLTVIMFAMNYLDLLATPLITWTLGEFLCWYIPVGQVLGSLASSLALLVIALDRYHNVIYALNKKWDPSLWKCLLGAAVLWGVCIGISYPMSTFYFHIPLRIPSGDVYMCTGTSTTRGDITFYYISANILFFLPLITMFFWFYYKIAILIWKHRKPVSSKSNTRIEESENSSYTKGTCSEQINAPRLKSIIKKKNIQVERKIRTFKVVIVLILAFIGLRMPYWVFWLYKLLLKSGGNNIWRFTFIFTSLNLLNCALNPFLYTYLNQSIYVCRKLNDFICKTCCCCFSNAEFEDYEKGTPIAEGVMGYNNVATVEQPKGEKNRPVYPYDKFPQVPNFPKYTSVNRF